MSDSLRVEVYVTEPHRMRVGEVVIRLGVQVEETVHTATDMTGQEITSTSHQIRVVVDGMPEIVESPNIRRATPGTTMFIDTMGGRQKVGTVRT